MGRSATVQSSITPMQITYHRMTVTSPLRKSPFCIACARRNRFAKDALDLAIDPGYEATALKSDLRDKNVSGVAGSIDLAASGQPLHEDIRSVARLTE